MPEHARVLATATWSRPKHMAYAIDQRTTEVRGVGGLVVVVGVCVCVW